MQVKDVMGDVNLRVSPGDDVVEVGKTMLKQCCSCAVVEDSAGKLLGILSKEGFVLGVKYLGGNPLEGLKVEAFMEESKETLKPDDLLEDAVEELLNVPYRIDRIPVVSGGDEVLGVLSKGHIVSLFADEVKGRFKVKDLMRFEPSTVYDYTTLRTVLDKLDESSDKRVMVLRGEKLVGILTIMDLAVALFEERVRKGDVFDWDIYADMKAEDVMTKRPVTVGSRDKAENVARLMCEKGLGGLPVVDKDLCGVISKTEIVKGYYIHCKNV
ncbi:MAG: CBS domain-containing protein [Candidatus Altiarchaeota archaeon]